MRTKTLLKELVLPAFWMLIFVASYDDSVNKNKVIKRDLKETANEIYDNRKGSGGTNERAPQRLPILKDVRDKIK